MGVEYYDNQNGGGFISKLKKSAIGMEVLLWTGIGAATLPWSIISIGEFASYLKDIPTRISYVDIEETVEKMRQEMATEKEIMKWRQDVEEHNRKVQELNENMPPPPPPKSLLKSLKEKYKNIPSGSFVYYGLDSKDKSQVNFSKDAIAIFNGVVKYKNLPKEIKSNTDKIDSNKEYVLLNLPINPDISTPIPIEFTNIEVITTWPEPGGPENKFNLLVENIKRKRKLLEKFREGASKVRQMAAATKGFKDFKSVKTVLEERTNEAIENVTKNIAVKDVLDPNSISNFRNAMLELFTNEGAAKEKQKELYDEFLKARLKHLEGKSSKELFEILRDTRPAGELEGGAQAREKSKKELIAQIIKRETDKIDDVFEEFRRRNNGSNRDSIIDTKVATKGFLDKLQRSEPPAQATQQGVILTMGPEGNYVAQTTGPPSPRGVSLMMKDGKYQKVPTEEAAEAPEEAAPAEPAEPAKPAEEAAPAEPAAPAAPAQATPEQPAESVMKQPEKPEGPTREEIQEVDKAAREALQLIIDFENKLEEKIKGDEEGGVVGAVGEAAEVVGKTIGDAVNTVEEAVEDVGDKTIEAVGRGAKAVSEAAEEATAEEAPAEEQASAEEAPASTAKRKLKGSVRTIISMNNVIADLNKRVMEAASEEEASRLRRQLENIKAEEAQDRKTLEERERIEKEKLQESLKTRNIRIIKETKANLEKAIKEKAELEKRNKLSRINMLRNAAKNSREKRINVEKNEDLERKLEELEKQLESKSEELRAKDVLEKKLKEINEELKGANEENKKTLEEANKKAEELYADLMKSGEVINDLERSNTELQQTVEADNFQIRELQKSRDELLRLNSELQVKFNKLETATVEERETLNNEIKGLEQKIAAEKKQIENLQQKVKAGESEIGKLQTSNTELQRSRDELKKLTDELQDKYKDLETASAEQKQRLNDEINKLTSEIKIREEELRNAGVTPGNEQDEIDRITEQFKQENAAAKKNLISQRDSSQQKLQKKLEELKLRSGGSKSTKKSRKKQRRSTKKSRKKQRKRSTKKSTKKSMKKRRNSKRSLKKSRKKTR